MNKLDELKYRLKRLEYWKEKRKVQTIKDYCISQSRIWEFDNFEKFRQQWQKDCDLEIAKEKEKIKELKKDLKLI